MFSAISNSTRVWCSKQTHSEIFCFLIIILNIFWDNSNCSSLALVFSKFSWHCGCPVYRGMYVTLKKTSHSTTVTGLLGPKVESFSILRSSSEQFWVKWNTDSFLPMHTDQSWVIKLWAKKNLQYYMFVGHRYICFSCLLTQHTGCLYNGNSHASIQR